MLHTLRACLVGGTVPFRSPIIQMSLFLPFQNGENAIFRAGTVAQRNRPIFAKQAINIQKDPSPPTAQPSANPSPFLFPPPRATAKLAYKMPDNRMPSAARQVLEPELPPLCSQSIGSSILPSDYYLG